MEELPIKRTKETVTPRIVQIENEDITDSNNKDIRLSLYFYLNEKNYAYIDINFINNTIDYNYYNLDDINVDYHINNFKSNRLKNKHIKWSIIDLLFSKDSDSKILGINLIKEIYRKEYNNIIKKKYFI